MQKRKEGAIRAGRPKHGIRASALFRYLTERGFKVYPLSRTNLKA